MFQQGQAGNTPGQGAGQGAQGSLLTEDLVQQQIERYGMPWVDQLNHHTVLTVQALQRLHTAFDGKFSR